MPPCGCFFCVCYTACTAVFSVHVIIAARLFFSVRVITACAVVFCARHNRRAVVFFVCVILPVRLFYLCVLYRLLGCFFLHAL